MVSVDGFSPVRVSSTVHDVPSFDPSNVQSFGVCADAAPCRPCTLYCVRAVAVVSCAPMWPVAVPLVAHSCVDPLNALPAGRLANDDDAMTVRTPLGAPAAATANAASLGPPASRGVARIERDDSGGTSAVSMRPGA